MPEDHDDGYTGPATLTVDGLDLPVRVQLDARHEPHDGKLHWFGRLRVDPGIAVPRALTAGTGRFELRTDSGRARAHIGDLDLWGRYRVTGVGTPPFRP
ncbi:MAG: DUF4873 domain-containing protein [Pseudonocardia sp.]